MTVQGRIGTAGTAAALLAAALAAGRVGAAADPGVISRIAVVPVQGGAEVRVEGRGELEPRISKMHGGRWLVLDFPATVYQAHGVAYEGAVDGLTKVRGAQFQTAPAPVSRVVVEMAAAAPFEGAASPGRFTLAIGRAARDLLEASPVSAAPSPSATPAATAPAAAAKSEAEPAPAADGARARVLHGMLTDLPDRVRLVVTADGVLRYKVSSREGGRELLLSLYDVDLAWSPARLAERSGPIAEVHAAQVTKPSRQVHVTVKLREARPYFIRKDQNQVVVEVEKAAGEDVARGDLARRRGDLRHQVTMNVQNEDLVALVKALSFEAGFDNVVLSRAVQSQARANPVSASLRDVPLDKALNMILAPMGFVWKVEGGVLRVGTAQEFDTEIEAVSLSGSVGSAAQPDEGGYVTRVFKLKHVVLAASGPQGAPSGLIQAVSDAKLSSNRFSVVVDQRSNSLIVTDVASNMPKIARIIRDLDVPVPQVMIKARLVQVRQGRSQELGVNWTGERATPANPTVSAVASDTPASTFQLRTGLLGPGFNLDATLHVLQANGDAQTLLNPSIATLQDQQAKVETQETRSFEQVTQQTLPDGSLRIDRTFVTVPVPMSLMVTPHVNPDGTVVMRVEIVMTEARETGRPGPPDLTTQRAQTQLLVRDRETGVIGGILRDRVSKTVRKVPLLGDLPWFLGGGLFRHTADQTEKVELVLFLTPSISEEI